MREPGKTISSLFLVTMLLPLTFCVVAEMKQRQLKHQARERLESLCLKTIILSTNEFQWTETGKEISIRGDLFDVKSYSLKNGKFIFCGLFDKEETALDKLEHNWKKNQEDNKLLTQLFQALQSVFHNLRAQQDPHETIAFLYPYLTPDRLSFQPKEVTTPPPQS